MMTVIWVYLVAERSFWSDKLSVPRLSFFRRFGLFWNVTSVHFVDYILYREQQIVAVHKRIIVIVRRNKSDIAVGKPLNIHTCLDIISSKPRKVFDDNKIDFALINVRKHFFEGRSVKVRSAATVITIEFVVCNFMIFAVLLKQNFLSFDRNTSSKVSVINRKSAIKCCLVMLLFFHSNSFLSSGFNKPCGIFRSTSISQLCCKCQ